MRRYRSHGTLLLKRDRRAPTGMMTSSRKQWGQNWSTHSMSDRRSGDVACNSMIVPGCEYDSAPLGPESCGTILQGTCSMVWLERKGSGGFKYHLEWICPDLNTRSDTPQLARLKAAHARLAQTFYASFQMRAETLRLVQSHPF